MTPVSHAGSREFNSPLTHLIRIPGSNPAPPTLVIKPFQLGALTLFPPGLDDVLSSLVYPQLLGRPGLHDDVPRGDDHPARRKALPDVASERLGRGLERRPPRRLSGPALLYLSDRHLQEAVRVGGQVVKDGRTEDVADDAPVRDEGAPCR